VTLPLAPTGSIGAPAALRLPYDDNACAIAIGDDGLGIAFDSTKGAGLITVSEPPCGGQGAGATFVSFGSDGGVQAGSLQTSVGVGPDLSLSPAHPLAPSFAGGDYDLVYVSQATAYRSTIVGAKPTSAVAIGSAAGALAASIASTRTLRAQLVDRAVDGGPVAEVYTEVPPGGDRLAATIAGATVAAIASSPAGALAVAATPPGLVWQSFDTSGAATAASANAAVPGTFSSLDVAATGIAPSYVLAAGSPHEITLVGLAGSEPTAAGYPLSSQPVLRDLLATFDGRHLAVSAGGGVVAVAWLTRHALGHDDPTGGWALLSCP
jgi:hypothetical protein